MKIRIKGNSLRYRLTKSDVNNLATNGCLEEYTCFGEQTLVYALKSNKENAELSAILDQNRITLYMPENLIKEWIATDRVGFDNNNNGLYLLVEKDFTCLDNVAEDQSDNYPNPLAAN